MTTSIKRQQLLQALATVFQESPDALAESRMRDSIPAWDSMGTLMLIAELDERLHLTVEEGGAEEAHLDRRHLHAAAAEADHRRRRVSVAAGEDILEALRRDRERYAVLGGWYRNLGFWVGATYRFGEWARALPRPLGLPLRLLHRAAASSLDRLLHVRLDADRIGPGLCLIHPHCIMVAGGTVIGRDCLVFHEVTLGTNVARARGPVIGDGVDLYVGARVLGPVSIGDRAMVGANCVVTQDVPPGSVVAPAPARTAPRTALSRLPGPASEA